MRQGRDVSDENAQNVLGTGRKSAKKNISESRRNLKDGTRAVTSKKKKKKKKSGENDITP
jgi:hypothetical protein